MRKVLIAAAALCFLIAFLASCGNGSDDDPSTGSGQDDTDDADDDTGSPADDDSTASDDTSDDTSADDTSDDTTADDSFDDTQDDTDDDTYPQLVMPPDDGRLWAAAARAVITPNEENHPGPIYLGGTSGNRVATGVHDDLLASALLLATHDEHAVIVSLDLIGLTRVHTRHIQEELEKYGLDGRHVFVASTHTHEGPDTVGIWGPDELTSGASPTYAKFLEDTVAELVVSAWDGLVPVNMKAGSTAIDEPASNFPSLIRDSRKPAVVVNRLAAAAFDDDDGQRVATLVNWSSHPESNICTREITSDYPHYLRGRTEFLFGGETVFISGSIGGLATPLGVTVPGRDDDGNPMLDGEGHPILFDDCNWDHTRSLGFILSEYTVQALSGAEPIDDPSLAVAVEDLWIPLQNLLFWAGFHLGVIDYDLDDLVAGRPGICGLLGCISEQIGVIDIGPVTIVTSPGETLAETLIGREEVTIDFGGSFGPFTFPAMEGYEAYLGDALPMHIGLCNDEIGYMVPRSDFHGFDHPDFYEESVSVGFKTETLYRRLVIEMLAGR